jgi:osmotically-inducible protein OsmY
MTLHLRGILVLLLSLMPLQACAPLLVAGAGTAAIAAHDRRTLGAQVDDETIELKTAAAIKSDEELRRDAHINVTSVNGIVLLSGEAATPELRDRIISKVREVAGIRRTVNEIRVTPPSPFGARAHDTWLTTKVKAKLVRAENLDSTQVKVVTENEAVYLLGLVSRQEAEQATEAARTVGGIARVVKLFEYLD